MHEIGNENANQIFEGFNLSELKIYKPDPESDRQTRERFMRMKYEQKKFVPKANASPDDLNQVFSFI